MSFNPNMSNKEVADLIFLDFKDQKPFLNLDFANVTTTGLQSERTFATGGQGAPNRVGFDSQRNGTLTIESQITPMKLYSMVSGSEIETSAKYMKREVLTAESTSVTLSATPIESSVHVYSSDDDCGVELEVTVADTVVTIDDVGFTSGEVIVYYLVEVTEGAQTVKFNSKAFPKAFTVYGETPWKTEDDEIVAMHLTYYKVLPQSNFELTFSNGSDVTTLSIVCDLLADNNGDIYDMSIIED